MMPDGLAFTFVVDGPRLQAQALILAASLTRHHPNALLQGCCPGAGLDDLPKAVRETLEGLKVDLTPLPIPDGIWAQPYPHGNKMLALATPRPQARHSVFLDTDMVMLQPLLTADLPEPFQVSVVPEGIRGWGKDETRWQRAYEFIGLPMPTDRIRLLRGRQTLSPPYFNGGFVAINETGKVDGKNFGALWRDTASAFDHHAPLGGKRPWLDQICLPLTMARHGFSYRILGEVNNCSVSNGRDLSGLSDARIIHYHRSAFLRAWPGSDALIQTVLDICPPAHRDTLSALMTDAGFLGPMQESTPIEQET